MNDFASTLIHILTMPTAVFVGQSQGRPAESPPAGVQRILPRGGIPAVFNPVFVAAADAEIPDDAWVLGVVVDGLAKAYSLNLLNRHEVVNNHFASRPLAAVW